MSLVSTTLIRVAKVVLESRMYEHACGKITTHQLKRVFKKLGWKVDLRKWVDNTLEAVDPNGDVHILEC